MLPAPLVNPAAGQIATTALPANGDTPGARGNTMHGLVNAHQHLAQDRRCSTRRRCAAELTFMRWLSVTQNEAVFKGRGNYVNADGSTPIDKVTKNYAGLGINFTPTWFQVFPGVDLSAPIAWSQGLSGNAAVLLGGNKGAGNYSLGVAADIYQKYKVSLQYIGYYGNYSTDPATGAARHRQRHARVAVRPRLGVAHAQGHVLRRRSQSCFANHSWRSPSRRWPRARRSRRYRPTRPSNWARR